MAMHPTMLARSNDPSIRFFNAVRIELPTGAINVIDGSAEIAFPVNGTVTTFSGNSRVGSIDSISPITDAQAQEAPRLQFQLLPPDTGDLADLGATNAQLSPVYAWTGYVDEPTGIVIGLPLLHFTGFVDVLTITHTGTRRFVVVEVASDIDRFLVGSEGVRLNDGWHQSVHPGEDALAFIASSAKYPLWGVAGALQPGSVPASQNTIHLMGLDIPLR